MARLQLILCTRVPQYIIREIKSSTTELFSGEPFTELFAPNRLSLQPRDLVEDDPCYRQFIGYGLVKCGNDYATYRRAGSEKRIHGQLSCGFGGHVGFPDLVELGDTEKERNGMLDVPRTMSYALYREMREELGVVEAHTYPVRFLGMILSQKTAVDLVHLGFVSVVEVPSRDVIRLDEGDGEIKEVTWFTAQEMRTQSSELETWSQIVIDHLVSEAEHESAPQSS